jgi:hypothetical protein
MTNIEPSGGTVVLRGHTIAIDSDIGRQFAIDCVRFIEGILTEEQLRKKFGLLTDAQWRELSDIEPLQLLIGRIKEERIRDGTAQREKASLRWNSAIDVIDSIVRDPTTPVRARIDGARELRACSTGTEDNKPDARERFTIHINFGSYKLHRDAELKPIRAEERSPIRTEEREPLTIEHEDDMPEPRPTGIVTVRRNEYDV